MSKKGHAVNEAQLKARRTSLGKKTNEELITIILRKDKTERTLNQKVNAVLNDISALDKKYDSEIDKYRSTIEELEGSNRTISDIAIKAESEYKFWRNIAYCAMATAVLMLIVDFVM